MITFDDSYVQRSDDQTFERIRTHKQRFGSELLILAHHYQPESTYQFADITGDSLKLSDQASRAKGARYIVFCGVHFMAEVARMLCGSEQQVILPDLAAGCPMADMARIDQVEQCWSDLQDRAEGRTIVPIVYINSTAQIKAFCGRHDGAVCTSSNAPQIIAWALQRGDLVLFLPDQHLGRNSAYSLGYALDQNVVYKPSLEHGDLPHRLDDRIRFVLWAGHCYVHVRFSKDDVTSIRQAYPGARIVVHPECPFDVVQASDASGSTEYIIKTVADAKPGDTWAVGTEKDLVDRLARRHAGHHTVVSLSTGSYCSTMKRCTAQRLLWVLDNLAEGHVVNAVSVPPRVRDEAMIALKRMLELRATTPKAVKE